MFARFSALKRSDRLRVIGWLVLGISLAGDAVLYWIQVRSEEVALNDMTALGYTKSMQHGMGVMMGSFGLMLSDWQQNIASPIGQFLTIAICAALVAGYFFRVAWVLDADEAER